MATMIKIHKHLFLTLLVCLLILPTEGTANDLTKWFNVAKDAVTSTLEAPESEELAMGDGLSARLLGAAGLVNDTDVQRYVNTIGMLLAQQTERPNLPWRFGVLDTDTVNAFAAPGGNVFITRGLFLLLGSEDELAGVLAHEIGHVLAKHHLNAIRHKKQMNVATQIAGNYIEADKQITDLVLNSGMELYSLGLDRDDEFEADKLGVVIAARAGYDAFGLPLVLQLLDSLDPNDADLGFMFATHPPTRERLTALDEAMGHRFDGMTASQLRQRQLFTHQQRLTANQ